MTNFISGLVVALFVVVATVEAACNRVDVPVSSGSEFQAALEKAQPGWNIFLSKGVYSDEYKLTNSGAQGCPITISSKVPGEAVIQSSLSLTSFVVVSNLTFINTVKGSWCVYVEGNDVVINNVNMSGTGGQEDGIMLSNTKDVTVKNCVFQNIGDHPLNLKNAKKTTVELCTFGDGNGCHRPSSSFIWMHSDSSSNVIRRNIFYGTNCADEWIEISYMCSNSCVDNEISENVFENPDGREMDQGIWCRDGSNTLIKENFMSVKAKNYAIRVDDTKQRICASNKVFGTNKITDGKIDASC